MEVKELLAKGFFTLLLRSIGAALLFVMALVFARQLGAEEFGMYSLAFTVVTITAVIGRFGMANIALKQISAHLLDQPKVSKGYFKGTLRLTVIVGALSSILIYLCSPWLADTVFSKPELEVSMVIFSFAILPIALLFVYGEAFKSYGKTLLATFGQTVLAPATTLVIIGVLIVFELVNLQSIIASVIAGFLVAVFWFYMWSRSLVKDTCYDSIGYLTLIKQGWPMLLASSGSLVMAWSDMIILGVYSNESDLGIYSAASRTVLVTGLILAAMNSITAPKFAAYYKSGDLEGLKKLTHLSSAILLVLVTIPVAILLIYPEWIMALFGSEFIAGASILIVLTVGQFVNVACGSVGYLLSMTGKEHAFKNILLTTALFNIALSLILVNHYGVFGVAIATSISIMIWNIWSMIEVRRHLGFWTFGLSAFNYK